MDPLHPTIEEFVWRRLVGLGEGAEGPGTLPGAGSRLLGVELYIMQLAFGKLSECPHRNSAPPLAGLLCAINGLAGFGPVGSSTARPTLIPPLSGPLHEGARFSGRPFSCYLLSQPAPEWGIALGVG
jgi:hypothetical protein